MTTETTDLYVDHESPQACQALAPMRELERNLDVTRDWLPHTLDIPAFPGSAGASISDKWRCLGTP